MTTREEIEGEEDVSMKRLVFVARNLASHEKGNEEYRKALADILTAAAGYSGGYCQQVADAMGFDVQYPPEDGCF